MRHIFSLLLRLTYVIFVFIFIITGEEQPFAISAVLAVLIGLVGALVILAIIIIFIVKSRSSGDNSGKLNISAF